MLSDHGDEAVQKFTTDGTFVKEWDIQRTRMSDLIPSDMAADSAGNVYVVDPGDDTIQKFTTDGTFVKEWNVQRTKISPVVPTAID